MASNITDAVARAKYLLNNVQNAAMATVNDDGSPHNTPFFFIHDNPLRYIYWSSQPESLHSKNIERDGRIFVVVYEANEGGGLYIEADEAHVLKGDELIEALDVNNALRFKEGKGILAASYYANESPQRMYSAKPNHLYVNYSERNTDGKITRDIRHEVTIAELS